MHCAKGSCHPACIPFYTDFAIVSLCCVNLHLEQREVGMLAHKSDAVDVLSQGPSLLGLLHFCMGMQQLLALHS